MNSIKLENITKRFKNITALNGISLEVKIKEFIILFGPAGAGKTTLLKVIAGLETTDDGIVKFDDEIMNSVPPEKRNVSMVFENYALYPHMTVFDNIASPLRSKPYRKSEEFINEEVHRITRMLNINELLDRLPSQISNGQKQRTALGRCMIRNPRIFLMDEPLAHLDAKLRNSMRIELKKMQKKLNKTTIYVTHDYQEALSLGDRIVVINEGQIIQIGDSNKIYYEPRNEFVAKLIGEPEINIIEGGLVDNEIKMLGQKKSFEIEKDVYLKLKEKEVKKIDIGIRANDIKYWFTEPDVECLSGKIYSFEPIGNKAVLVIEINDKIIRAIAPSDLIVTINEPVYLQFDLKKALFFDKESKELIIRHGQKEFNEEKTSCQN